MIGPEPLGRGERTADDQDRGKDLECFFPAYHGPHQPEGNDHGGDRKDAPDHRVEIALVQRGHSRQGVHGRADGAPGHRRSVGNQIEGRGLKRLEAKTDHKSAGDGDRRTEPSAAFNERAEAERHEQELQTPIRRDGRDGLLHDFELAGLDRNIVEKNRRDHDPDDFQQAERRPVKETADCEHGGHLENDHGHEHRGRRPRDSTKVWPHLQPRQEP